jgi:hypothetical protein
MMGLFDSFQYDPLGYTGLPEGQKPVGGLIGFLQDPRNAQGLAQFGRALAQAGAPSRIGPTWGGALSDAFAGFNEGRQAYDQNEAAKALRALQIKKLQSELDEKAAQAAQRQAMIDRQAEIQKLMSGNTAMGLGASQGDIGPTKSNGERIPTDPIAEILAKAQLLGSKGYVDESLKYMKQAKDLRDKMEIAPSGEVYNPFEVKPGVNLGKVEYTDFGGFKVPTNPAGKFVGGQINKTQSPDSVASNNLGWAKLNLEKETRAEDKNAGKLQYDATRGGLVNLATGEFKPVLQDGKPIETKASREAAKDEIRRQSIISGAEGVLKEISDAKKLTGMTTAGVAGLAKYVPATNARNLAAKLTTIQSNLGFDKLQQMRQESPTGGALGQVAVQELVALQSTIASLDQLQDPQQLYAALNKIEKHYKNWVDVMKRAKKEPSVDSDGIDDLVNRYRDK